MSAIAFLRAMRAVPLVAAFVLTASASAVVVAPPAGSAPTTVGPGVKVLAPAARGVATDPRSSTGRTPPPSSVPRPLVDIAGPRSTTGTPLFVPPATRTPQPDR